MRRFQRLLPLAVLLLAVGCSAKMGGIVIESAFNAIKKTFLGVATSAATDVEFIYFQF